MTNPVVNNVQQRITELEEKLQAAKAFLQSLSGEVEAPKAVRESRSHKPLRQLVLEALEDARDQTLHVREIKERIKAIVPKFNEPTIHGVLALMHTQGVIERVDRGLYQMRNTLIDITQPGSAP